MIEPSCLLVSLSANMPSHQVSHLDCGLHECDLPNWREIYSSVKSLHLGSCVSDFNLKEVFIILIIKKTPGNISALNDPIPDHTPNKERLKFYPLVFSSVGITCIGECVGVQGCVCVCVCVSEVSINPSQLSKCPTTFHLAKINELQSN